MRTSKLFKVLSFTLPVTITGSLFATSCSNNNTFEVEIEIPEGSGIEFSNRTATLGQKFESDITSPIEIHDINVTVDDFELPDHAIIFNPLNEQYKYYFKIFGSYVTSKKITIDVITEPLVDSFKITFNAGDGVIAGTSQSSIDLEFDEEITWENISNKPEGFLQGHSFGGWTLTQGSNDPVSNTHLFTGNETVYAIYSDCEHEFDKYWVTGDHNNRRVHGHCPKCGTEDIELNDAELKELEGSFLVKNADQTFSLISDQELSFYIGSHSTLTEFDIYPIWGTYEISTSRSQYNRANVRIHGVNDYNGNITSALDSYNNEIEGEGTEGSIYYNLGISLYLDNMILQGRNTSTYWGFQGGIQTDYLSCEYCTLLGQMATYSARNEFKHCHFDSTGISDDPEQIDYAIWCYAGSSLIENCSFVSDGKAIKIYNGQGEHLNEIYNCTFTIDNRLKGKAAVEIDPVYCSVSDPCVVYLYQNVLDETYQGLELYHVTPGYEEGRVNIITEHKLS